tara:strand:+ start:2363 stop:2719 length:357 start_codon:yes stop_codon:yes gene_type:complete
LWTACVRTFGSKPLLTSEINHHPIDNSGVEISINKHKKTMILLSDRLQDHQHENSIATKKKILAASLGVDQPLWSFLGANKYSTRPMADISVCCFKNACLSISWRLIIQMRPLGSTPQ